eukprot:3613324-Heterocapsa_arctica.AAC.1
MDPEKMLGRQHTSPMQIPVCQGPDRYTWDEQKTYADQWACNEVAHPVDPQSTDQDITEAFIKWSRAAEGHPAQNGTTTSTGGEGKLPSMRSRQCCHPTESEHTWQTLRAATGQCLRLGCLNWSGQTS